MKAEYFPHYNHPKLGLPPGFVALMTMTPGECLGFLPDENGNCRLVQITKGSAISHLPTRIAQFPEQGRKSMQRRWLRSLRLEDADLPGSIEAELGISPRTWQGWEQGRPVPYFQAVRLAQMIWDQQRRSAIA